MTAPNESVPSTSPFAELWKRCGPMITKYLESNLMTALWSVLLFVGGVIFVIYFWHIRFMPELDLKTSVALLAVCALTGIFLFVLIIVLALYLLYPGWNWAGQIGRNQLLKSPLWFALPMSGVLTSVFLPRWRYVIAVWVFSVLIPVLLLSLRKLPYDADPKDRWRAALIFVWALVTSGLIFLVLHVVLLSSLVQQDPSGRKHPISSAVAGGIFILFSNTLLVVPAVRSASFWRKLFPVLGVTLFLFLLLGATFIPNRVMTVYKFGNLTNASLVLDETGCAIVQRYGLKVAPYTPEPKSDIALSSKTCSLSNVTIHSRLGNTYYVEVSRGAGTSLRFTIPGQDVLSWAVDESKKPTTSGPPTDTPHPR